MEKKCISCGKKLMNDSSGVIFLCPNCGKYELVRCSVCRRLGAKYKCPQCSFEGPN